MNVATVENKLRAGVYANSADVIHHRPTPAGSDKLRGIVLALMGVVLLALFCLPIRRIVSNVQIQYNEGWNAYKQAMTVSGVPLYGQPRQHFIGGTGYPPLSFHLIGWLGQSASVVIVGRFISLVSLLVAGLFVALIVRKEGASPTVTWFAFLLYEAGIAILAPDRVGMNDPQLLAEALSAAGLYCYLRRGSSYSLYLSAVLFCLCGFTKQTMIAVPLAVGLDLLLHRPRKEFVTWAGTIIVTASLLFVLTLSVDGHFFVRHLTTGRAYSLRAGWGHTRDYLLRFQVLLIIGGIWSAAHFRNVLAWTFWTGHVLAVFLAGGDGVVLNIFFGAFMATVIACALALGDLKIRPEGAAPAVFLRPQNLLMIAICVGILVQIPERVRSDFHQMADLPKQEKEYASTLEFVKASPGPALCETLLLCYDAGKPLEYDAFSALSQIKTGWTKESEVAGLIKTRHFQIIEVDVPDPQIAYPVEEIDGERFTPAMMDELRANYRLTMRTSQALIFVPK